MGWLRFVTLVSLGLAATGAHSASVWPRRSPEAVGLDARALARFSGFVGGRGVVVRQGHLVHEWGDPARRGDVASACKPVFAHFLFRALADRRIASLDEPVVRWEPRLTDLNPDLDFKDRAITWRHLASQTSGYGMRQGPGRAFAYNDWQIALFGDLLFTNVYGVAWPEVDARILGPELTEPLGCEDQPSLTAHGGGAQPGRLVISPRDFARFGQLYLQQGRWQDRTLLPADLVRLATRTPLPADLPRARDEAASMLPGQRTLGSRKIPDNQTDHFGSYSFLWWVNGVDREGRRHWPDAPLDTFAALGHGGIRALVIVPSLDLVVSWNDAQVNSLPREQEALRLLVAATQPLDPPAGEVDPRRRVFIETDAGGDPDDEQSLVRFLLYANEWEIEGIIANRPVARPRENLNHERTGLGIVRRLVEAYGAGWSNLVRHDPRYPEPSRILARTVAGYDGQDDGVTLLIAAVDRDDPRPLWYSDWGSDRGASTNNLRRALDRVLATRGPEGYARFKSRLRLVSGDQFGPHSRAGLPPFPLWVDTWRPEMDGRRWYHRFSALTARAGGFDLTRDSRTGHGPLGALYPTNTTHPQKEGDSLSFLYLVPNGLNVPERPGWGGWGGRLGHRPGGRDQPFFWANLADAWGGTTHREATLQRWAEDLQNDFRARLDWCVEPPDHANHPPRPRLDSRPDPLLVAGERREFGAASSWDPDAHPLHFEWLHYPEPGTWRGPVAWEAMGDRLTLTAPDVSRPETLHFILRVRDAGDPPLTRYQRLVLTILPRDPAPAAPDADHPLSDFARPPGDPAMTATGPRPRPLRRFEDGRPVERPADWAERRVEIRSAWEEALGSWPPRLERPVLEVLSTERREGFTQQKVRLPLSAEVPGTGYVLIPDGKGPFPAVLVVFYDPETSVGLRPDRPGRDFARQLTRRGMVTLALGTPGGDAWKPDLGTATCQPLSFHAYVAANAWTVLAGHPQVDARRIGVTGHSYGGKWALFAAALEDRFAAVAVSDPGVVFDETRPNVNYWEPWYLGRDPRTERRPGVPSADNPRTGAYARLVDEGRDLHEIHGLIAPRPFLVLGGPEDPVERWLDLREVMGVNALLGRPGRVFLTQRPVHDPTPEAHEQMGRFFEYHLGGRSGP